MSIRYLLFLTLLSSSSVAQVYDSSDLKSIDGTVNALLHQISIKKGEKMDTTAVRNLFHPVAQLTILNNANSPNANAETVSLNEFLSILKDPYYEEGYLEQEIDKVIDEYNGIAQVFQSFYGKDSEGNEERGITSYQLAYYQDRWWIVSILWTIVPEGSKLPEKYTGK